MGKVTNEEDKIRKCIKCVFTWWVNAAPKFAPQYPKEQNATKLSHVEISLFKNKKVNPSKNSPEKSARIKEIKVEPEKKEEEKRKKRKLKINQCYFYVNNDCVIVIIIIHMVSW